MGKDLFAKAGNAGLLLGLGRFPWRRKWLLTPVFLPGEFHGQRSLAGYSSWSHKSLTRQGTHTLDARERLA